MTTTIYVQFGDATDTTIVSVFSCPQDPSVWPNQGTVQSNDARYKAYYNALPSAIQVPLVKPGD